MEMVSNIVLTLVLMLMLTLVDKHLTHFTKAVDCCLKERSKQNTCVDVDKDNGVEDSVDNSVDT
eukprot:12943589-Ditylum_brightwellii.AAC.1